LKNETRYADNDYGVVIVTKKKREETWVRRCLCIGTQIEIGRYLFLFFSGCSNNFALGSCAIRNAARKTE